MPNLVTVVGENTHMLPHMLKHYEDKVDKVFVVVYRQSENDGILEEIEELGIEPYLVVTEEKYNWEKVTHLYNRVKSEFPNKWWIVSDDDELQVYPYPIEDIIRDCENKGYMFVTGGFLDRIGEDGHFPYVDKDTDIQKAFPLAGFFRYPLSGAMPNKVTLMKGNIDVTPGQHFAKIGSTDTWRERGWNHPLRYPVEEVFTQVHHFKWDESCVRRIRRVANNKKEYSYSDEYRKMFNAIKANDFRIDINNPEFLVERLQDFSYIGYTNWDKLTNTIINI